MSISKFEPKIEKPSREEAEDAVRTLLLWIGENPYRDGLVETPARYIRAFEEYFSGYGKDAKKELSKTFKDIEEYDDMVLVRNIEFISHCEHHIVPIIGVAHVAYWPNKKVVGISKLARIVDIMSKRLTSQENMTREIAQSIDTTLNPKGVAVLVDANHQCMSTRGVSKMQSSTITNFYTGEFKSDKELRNRFLSMTQYNSAKTI